MKPSKFGSEAHPRFGCKRDLASFRKRVRRGHSFPLVWDAFSYPEAMAMKTRRWKK